MEGRQSPANFPPYPPPFDPPEPDDQITNDPNPMKSLIIWMPHTLHRGEGESCQFKYHQEILQEVARRQQDVTVLRVLILL